MASFALRSSDLCNHSKGFSHVASVQIDERLCPRKVIFRGWRRRSVTIRAVAHLEPKCRDHDDQVGSIGLVISFRGEVESAVGLDEKEKSRRAKISRANTGIVPWNKGKRHSAETIQKIRERTKLAMQTPKVRAKLVYFGHKQSEDTRMKIGAGVRMGWIRRRKKIKAQKTCLYKWHNLIAEGSREGLFGGKEMEWNSYSILDKQLEKEWLHSVEQRKSMPRPKGCKRAPKSLEQRRKIAEAIAAKWADPEYRERVFSGMAKYYGANVRTEGKPRRRRNSEKKYIRQNSAKEVTGEAENAFSKGNIERSTVHISNKPLYEDPPTNSKLEMIKNIRSRRKAAESDIAETVERSRLLIAQAEKAAETLKLVSKRSATAQAALLETRALVAKAIQLIKAVEARDISSIENLTLGSSGGEICVSDINRYEKIKSSSHEPSQRSTVNGRQSPVSSNLVDFDFAKFTLQNALNLESRCMISGSCEMNMLSNKTREIVHSDKGEGSPGSVRVKKKWVRGRLVEVADDA